MMERNNNKQNNNNKRKQILLTRIAIDKALWRRLWTDLQWATVCHHQWGAPLKDEGQVPGSDVNQSVLSPAVEGVLTLVQGDYVGVSKQPGWHNKYKALSSTVYIVWCAGVTWMVYREWIVQTACNDWRLLHCYECCLFKKNNNLKQNDC